MISNIVTFAFIGFCFWLIWRLTPYSSANIEKQTTFIHCGECGNEMVGDGISFISDTYDNDGNNHVRYKCSKCGQEYDYNFDVAPVPINWKELNK